MVSVRRQPARTFKFAEGGLMCTIEVPLFPIERSRAHHGSEMDRILGGKRILVVEDDFLIWSLLNSIFSEEGAEVIGPCGTVNRALALAETEDLSIALLDYRLGRDTDTSISVARRLTELRVPFAFYTGQIDIDPIRANGRTAT
jgi:CheY-like chemotaxis protein